MKTILKLNLLALALATVTGASAQTVYNVKSNTGFKKSGIPSPCINCAINIAKGVTLTIDQDVQMSNSSINGGNLVIDNKELTFLSAGVFNDVAVTAKKSGSLVSSNGLKVNNSNFTFEDKSTATFNSSVDMVNSDMTFADDANMLAQSGTFNLLNGSSLTAGDGTNASKAFIKFNGATLNVDNYSFVTAIGSNNYYFNWAAYKAGSKTYTTTNNNMNCGTPGKNACNAASVYGPATMSYGGVSSNATMPVILSAFTAKLVGVEVKLSFTTDMEAKADRFEIERSIDGLNWAIAGTVKAVGYSNSATHYGFTDLLKTSSIMSYRLKMIDLDGSFEYSDIRTVKGEQAVEMNIYPNPATEYVMISSKSTASKMNVQLINTNGQVLKQVSGSNKINMPVNEFRPGNYIVRVVGNDGAANSFKLMITK